jgi:hypothetical protein
VQTAPAPDPSPSSSPEGGGNRTPELVGTLATAASLKFRGGGGLRSRGGIPTSLEPPSPWSRGEGAIEAAKLEGRCMWRSGWIHREEERRLARAAMEWGGRRGVGREGSQPQRRRRSGVRWRTSQQRCGIRTTSLYFLRLGTLYVGRWQTQLACLTWDRRPVRIVIIF